MPNPFVGNDEAAAYLVRLGTPAAIAASVTRLHSDGVQRRREAVRRIEAEVYPPQQPPLRSSAEIAAHAQQMASEETTRRRQRLAEAERAVYGGLRRPLAPVSDAAVAKRCHDDAVALRARREARVAAMKVKCGEPASPTASERERREQLAARERKFRPAVVAHHDPLASASKLVLAREVPVPAARPNPVAAKDLAEHYARLSRPRPHQQSQRRPVEKALGPQFSLYFTQARALSQAPPAAGAENRSPSTGPAAPPVSPGRAPSVPARPRTAGGGARSASAHA